MYLSCDPNIQVLWSHSSLSTICCPFGVPFEAVQKCHEMYVTCGSDAMTDTHIVRCGGKKSVVYLWVSAKKNVVLVVRITACAWKVLFSFIICDPDIPVNVPWASE